MCRLGIFLPVPVPVFSTQKPAVPVPVPVFIRVNFRLFQFADVVGRFLLVSPERVVRFQCGFRRLVAYSGWKKSWKFQNVGCNCWILVNFWIRTRYVKFVDKRGRHDGRFLLISPKRVVRFRCSFRCPVAYSGWKKSWKFKDVGCNSWILVNFWIWTPHV